MAYKVLQSDSSELDLDKILTYIAEKLSTPKAAADFADALDEKYEALERQPYMYELSRNKRLARLGYRRIVIDNYIALYLVNDERREVIIARIFYGKQNYERFI